MNESPATKIKVAIGIAATGRYCYALRAHAERVISSLQDSPQHEYFILLVGNKASTPHFEKYRAAIGKLAKVEFYFEDVDDDKKNYSDAANLIIAKLQGRYFHEARRLGADYCLSLESDVLPPANAIRVMIDALNFDDHYYDVAFIPYPSQGATGGFLSGFGTPQTQINQDVLPHERKLSDELKASLEASDKAYKDLLEAMEKSHKDLQEKVEKKEIKPSDDPLKIEPFTEKDHVTLKADNEKLLKVWTDEREKLNEQVNRTPPRGSVWALQGENYRRRGWLDNAYPGIGKGAIVQVDWVGLGCTMLSKKALALAHFTGYDGKGTQDLFLVWSRWHQGDLNLACITHALCDHIIRERKDDGSQSSEKLTIAHVYHESTGECRGHLRVKHLPFHG
jgi:hypothetical protein